MCAPRISKRLCGWSCHWGNSGHCDGGRIFRDQDHLCNMDKVLQHVETRGRNGLSRFPASGAQTVVRSRADIYSVNSDSISLKKLIGTFKYHSQSSGLLIFIGGQWFLVNVWKFDWMRNDEERTECFDETWSFGERRGCQNVLKTWCDLLLCIYCEINAFRTKSRR
jgi:hypothetical protein